MIDVRLLIALLSHKEENDNCVCLRQVNLPEGIEYIKLNAFNNCASLKELKVPTGCLNFEGKDNKEMKDRILQLLKDIELKHNVKVLLAVNSGSRSFGYASEASDWDVRFIYVHKPEWYFSISQTSDVIEYMNEEDGLDAEGFDLKKALTLLTKTNPIESDWLHSKEFFVCDEDFLKAMLQFEADCYNTKSAMYHFYSISVKHNDRYLQKEITLKRFIYYMRGLLACRWIEMHGAHPSVNLDELIDATITDNELVRTQAHGILALKRSGKQHDNSGVNEGLVNYMNDIRQHYEVLLPQYCCEKLQFDSAEMSRFLMDVVMRYE